MNETKRRILQEKADLWSERSSWDSQWAEIARLLLPGAGRFSASDRNRGDKRQRILNDTATAAHAVTVAGLMSGSCSPARPWIRMTVADKDKARYHSVKAWLDDFTRLVLSIMAKSNAYRAIPMIDGELVAFGTGAALQMNDFDTVNHFYPLTVGEYALGQDFRGNVDTFVREFEMTVGQMVKEFGYNNCSLSVRNLYDKGNYHTWVPTIHMIKPRRERDTTSPLNTNFKYAEYYCEIGNNDDVFLRESGHRRFRVLAPRWRQIGGNVYGYGPGHQALGKIAGLQHKELRESQGIDYQTKPPTQGPSARLNLLPGAHNAIEAMAQGREIKPVFSSAINLQHLEASIAKDEQTLWKTFHADVFLMISNAVNERGITATQVLEMREEKMLMLGPVIEGRHREFLGPMVMNAAYDALEAGIVPPPPEELAGEELELEFVSVLAQAQKSIATGALDRFVQRVGTIAMMKPEVLDRVTADGLIDAYADMDGIDPDVMIAVDKAFALRQSRAQAEAKQQELAAQQQQADTAASLAKAQTGGQQNALTDMMTAYQGYNNPQVIL